MDNTLNIKINRLILAVVLTFLVADTYPHPQLSPGLIETLGFRVHSTVTALLQK